MDPPAELKPVALTRMAAARVERESRGSHRGTRDPSKRTAHPQALSLCFCWLSLSSHLLEFNRLEAEAALERFPGLVVLR